jgi:hypothetical protein
MGDSATCRCVGSFHVVQDPTLVITRKIKQKIYYLQRLLRNLLQMQYCI